MMQVENIAKEQFFRNERFLNERHNDVIKEIRTLQIKMYGVRWWNITRGSGEVHVMVYKFFYLCFGEHIGEYIGK